MCSQNILTIIRKIYKNSLPNLRHGVALFTKLISTVMYGSINKQLTSFQNSFGVLPGLWQVKG